MVVSGLFFQRQNAAQRALFGAYICIEGGGERGRERNRLSFAPKVLKGSVPLGPRACGTRMRPRPAGCLLAQPRPRPRRGGRYAGAWRPPAVGLGPGGPPAAARMQWLAGRRPALPAAAGAPSASPPRHRQREVGVASPLTSDSSASSRPPSPRPFRMHSRFLLFPLISIRSPPYRFALRV